MLSVTAGQRIGRGVVVDPHVRTSPTAAVPAGRRGARLICDCGTEYEAPLGHLVARNGIINTKSCGCLGRNRLGEETRTHGLSSHELYQTWAAMVDRCDNPLTWEYRYYGARGVRVCARWHDVRLFIADVESEIGPRPPGMTLDRVNNDLGYEQGNVRWATRHEQVLNRHQPVSVPGGFLPSPFYAARG